MSIRYINTLLAAALVFGTATAAPAWQASWTAAPQPAWGAGFALPTNVPAAVDGHTVRETLRLSTGGTRLAAHLRGPTVGVDPAGQGCRDRCPGLRHDTAAAPGGLRLVSRPRAAEHLPLGRPADRPHRRRRRHRCRYLGRRQGLDGPRLRDGRPRRRRPGHRGGLRRFHHGRQRLDAGP